MPPAPAPPPAPPPGPPPSGAPRVSVLMPVFNAEATVERAARCVLDQTLRALELVVVDDGSTDGSAGVLDRLADADPRVRLLRRPNTGLTGALVDAQAAAAAPLLARMDADDTCDPTRLQRQVGFLDHHPEVGLISTGIRFVTAGGARLPADPRLQRAWAGGHGALVAGLERGLQTLCHAAMVVRRSALEDAGGYDRAYEPAEDLELFLRLSRRTRLACLAEPLYDVHLHAGSVSASRTREQIEAIRRAVAAYAGPGRRRASARLDLHRHLATLALAHRDPAAALAEGRRGLLAAPLHPRTLPWLARLLTRATLGPAVWKRREARALREAAGDP